MDDGFSLQIMTDLSYFHPTELYTMYLACLKGEMSKLNFFYISNNCMEKIQNAKIKLSKI